MSTMKEKEDKTKNNTNTNTDNNNDNTSEDNNEEEEEEEEVEEADDDDDDTPTEDQNAMSESEDVTREDEDDDDDGDDDEDEGEDNDDDEEESGDNEKDDNGEKEEDTKEEKDNKEANKQEEKNSATPTTKEEETTTTAAATLEPNPSLITSSGTASSNNNNNNNNTRRATRNASSPNPTITPRTSKKRTHPTTSTSTIPTPSVPNNTSSEAAAKTAASAAASNASATAAIIAAAASAAATHGLTGIQSLLVGGVGGIPTHGTLLPTTTTTTSDTTTTTTNNNASTTASTAAAAGIPTIEAVRTASLKSITEHPPHVHLSSRDSAPQLTILDGPIHRRLVVRGGMRGYRMVRATHGVNLKGIYYYEVLVLKPPSVRDMLSGEGEGGGGNVRLGSKLRDMMQEQLVREEFALRRNNEKNSKETPKSKKQKLEEAKLLASTGPSSFATPPSSDNTTLHNATLPGHVRLGFSMRTGDLQAPVGYDRWSYGIRDIQGSRIHNSRREDKWCGGEESGFGVGDVVGFLICLTGEKEGDGVVVGNSEGFMGGGGASGGGDGTASDGETSSNNYNNNNITSTTTNTNTNKKNTPPAPTNHIRFFKNGQPIGNFIVSRNVRTGGEAFSNIQPGHYFPAVSAYMGGSAKVNFGPHFIYPPSKRSLPHFMQRKDVKPMSDLCPSPPRPEEAVADIFFKGSGSRAFCCNKKQNQTEVEGVIKAFRDAVECEAGIRYEAYCNHVRRHVEEVREGRMERGLSVADLPACTLPESSRSGGAGSRSEEKEGDEGVKDVEMKEKDGSVAVSSSGGGGGGEGIKT